LETAAATLPGSDRVKKVNLLLNGWSKAARGTVSGDVDTEMAFVNHDVGCVSEPFRLSDVVTVYQTSVPGVIASNKR